MLNTAVNKKVCKKEEEVDEEEKRREEKRVKEDKKNMGEQYQYYHCMCTIYRTAKKSKIYRHSLAGVLQKKNMAPATALCREKINVARTLGRGTIFQDVSLDSFTSLGCATVAGIKLGQEALNLGAVLRLSMTCIA